MRVLLDTHSFLWLVTDHPMLSSKAKSIFLDNDNTLLLSAISGFEIAVKYSLGKLELAEDPDLFIKNRIQKNALTVLPLMMEHAIRLAGLPFHHRDPFDRLLVAQAMVEQVPILSADSALSAYGIERIW
jgi:PIN domain nuclease of toxin-antitoxin system